MVFSLYPRQSSAGEAVRPAKSAPLILLAEDDEDLRALLRLTLEHDGYHVTDVATGGALLAELQRGAHEGEMPALVISDQHMPEASGMSVFEQTRRWGWALPLLLITAFRDHEVLERADGANVKVLVKPFDIDALRTLVQWYAPRRGKLDVDACAACGSPEDLSPMDDHDDVLFCADCRESFSEYDPTDPFIDLGGMG